MKDAAIKEKDKSVKQTSEEIQLTIDQLLNPLAQTVFSNLKIHVEERLQSLESFFRDLEDIKFNVSTLSTILADKGLFTQEEFSECFTAIKNSFGIVNSDGSMDGRVEITFYNC